MLERLITVLRTGRTRPMRPLLALVRLVTLGTIVAAIVIPVGFFILPIPDRADGLTLCLPAIGPLQQISDALSESETELVQAHEDMHAAQCRRMGAARFASMYWRTPGRIMLEAEAHCAELSVAEERGGDPGRFIDRTIEALHDGYRNEGAVSREEVEAVVGEFCGVLAQD